MARGPNWKAEKESKIAQFKTVDRVRVDNPVIPSASGQGGVDRLPSELPTSGADTSSVGSWGFGSNTQPVEVQDTTLQTNVTKDYDQSMNVLTAETPQDVTMMNTTNTGINMQNDVTKNTIINESQLFPGEEARPYEENIPWLEGNQPSRQNEGTMQVNYNVPGGGVMSTDVKTWQEDDKYYAEYGDSLLQADTQKGLESRAPVWLQAENQREAKESGLLEQYTRGGLPQADQGALHSITRTDKETGKTYDVFFGGKDQMPTKDQRDAIQLSYDQRDFNQLWGDVKGNIMSSMGVNPKGNTFTATKKGDDVLSWGMGSDGVTFGSQYGGKEVHNQGVSDIFGFYREKWQGNDDIVKEIDSMEQRWTVGGNKTKSGGLFGFNNTGPQSTGKNPMTYYTDMADVNKKQSMKDLNKKNVSQESYDKQVANINKIYDIQKTNKNLYKAYGNPDFYNMGL